MFDLNTLLKLLNKKYSKSNARYSRRTTLSFKNNIYQIGTFNGDIIMFSVQ